MDRYDRPLIPTPAKLLEDTLAYLRKIQEGFAQYRGPKMPDEYNQVAGLVNRLRDVLSQAEKIPFDNPKQNR